MKKYNKYKDSGIEWIGEIPEHWEVNKVKYNFVFKTGFTPPSGKSEYYENGRNIWINISDLQDKYISDSVNKISDKAITDFKPEIITKGSLLYSFKLSVGRVAFTTVDCYTNEAIFSIQPEEETNLNFFYYSLPGQIILNANENIYGAKILNQELIKNAFLVIPPTEEQSAIADYLDRKTAEIDQLIADKEALLKLYDEEKTAVINEAVTKGIDPNVKLKNSGIEWLGEIPEHWEVKKLKYSIESLKGGGTPATNNPLYWNGNIPWVSSKDMKKDFINCTQDYITDLAVKESSTSLIEPNSILLVVRSGILKHTLPVSINIVDVCINQDLKAIKTKDYIINEFLFWKIKGLNQTLLTATKKIGATVDSINIDSLLEFNFAWPPFKEQKYIIQHIESETARINEKIADTQKLIELLKEYRAALISEVVTGKVKVV